MALRDYNGTMLEERPYPTASRGLSERQRLTRLRDYVAAARAMCGPADKGLYTDLNWAQSVAEQKLRLLPAAVDAGLFNEPTAKSELGG